MRQHPFEILTKAEVEAQNRQCDVIAPPGISSLMEWWTSLPQDAQLTLSAHPERHGLALRTSNHAKKPETLQAFLNFIDQHRQQLPDSEDGNQQYVLTDRLRNLLDIFNSQQRATGQQTIRYMTAHRSG